MREFWKQVIAGAIDAMGGEANEPFGVWPNPPLSKPERWAKRTQPISPTHRKANS